MEAIAAALCITGRRQQAEELLSKFSWGYSFFALNRQVVPFYIKQVSSKRCSPFLDKYAQCSNVESVREAEKQILQEMEDEDLERRKLSM